MKLERKYGLFTAICMVVGIVVGSGIFFKAQNILNATEGNMTLGILAWIVGGVVMILNACTFAVMATKYEKVSGIVDWAEQTIGKKYGYYMGWFLSMIYFPAMTGVLAWVSARYFGELFGWNLGSSQVMTIGCLFLVMTYALNALAPKIAGKFQISTTIIKMIPLTLMAVVGLVYGLINTTASYKVVDIDGVKTVVKEGATQMKILVENFKNIGSSGMKVFFGACTATVFAYEGWIVATTINAELKNSKKNLPLALLIGTFIVVAIYVFYYIGVAGGATIDVLRTGGAPYSFLQIFGDFFGTVLKIFVVISCLGTLNGLMVGCSRGIFSVAARGDGPKPEVLSQIDEQTNMPHNSSVVGLLMSGIWFVYFYGACILQMVGEKPWFGKFSFDSSELPIITIYAMYIPIFIMMIIKERKNFGVIKGAILPILAILSCVFILFAAIVAHSETVLYYLIIFTVVMLIGFILKLYEKRISERQENK